MSKTEAMMRAQSRACKDYMKFLDNKIAEARKQNSIKIVEPVKGTNMILTYFRNK